MSSKVRYILGAGASYNAIPLVSQMPGTVFSYFKAFWNIGEYLKSSSKPNSILMERAKKIQELAGYFQQLSIQLEGAFSFDTLAKFYWAKGDSGEDHYLKLKEAIAVVILCEQIRKNRNSRYDAFIAALAIQKRELKGLVDIQIVNWNYDFQFWDSLREIKNDLTFEEANNILNQRYINGCVAWDMYPEKIPSSHDINKIQQNLKRKIPQSDTYNSIESLINPVLHLYYNPIFEEIKRISTEGLKFSWEVNLEELIMIRDDFEPDIAVIIGYSLPTFNRANDIQLLVNFAVDPKKHPNRKVYVQCKKDNEEIRSKLIGMNIPTENIVLIESDKEFFIPHEYDVHRLQIPEY